MARPNGRWAAAVEIRGCRLSTLGHQQLQSLFPFPEKRRRSSRGSGRFKVPMRYGPRKLAEPVEGRRSPGFHLTSFRSLSSGSARSPTNRGG